jgi:DNA recombination protein RmuC
MNWMILVIVGALWGVVVWIISHLVTKSRIAKEAKDVESRAIGAEARVDELRRQIAEADTDFHSLRQRLSDSERAKAVAETRVQEIEKALSEQRTLLEDAKVKLSDTFKALAADALAGNSKGFLALAEEKFKALKDEAKTDLDSRRTAIEEIIKPLSDSLANYQRESKELEEKRLKEVSSVSEQLRSLAVAQTSLQNETAKLVNALKSPQIRGRWGEIALKKTAELAGMSKHCDFVEQETVATDDGRLRPDMIVKLPAGREVVVDAKVPLGGFMEALEAETDESRHAALARHAFQVKQHVTKLAAKEYWNQFATAPEFVILFIPNDTFLAAAAEQDANLVESALSQGIIIATPTTFIALLRAIAFGWRQETIGRSAQHICALGQELSDRLATMTSHLVTLGKSIDKSVESYNSAVGSFESRVLSSARKFKELGAGGRKEVEELATIDHVPRALTMPDTGDE